MFKRIAKLAVWAIGLWFFFSVVTPRLISAIPAWEKYCAVQDAHGLDSGAIYYSDVPITSQAAEHVSQAVKEGMEVRRMRINQK